MSVDALSAAAAANADLAAIIEAELAQLAADAQALRGVLLADAVVTARVLPSNGLTDLLEVAGRRVAASLPPTVRPGDVLQVRVTGFDAERILLQIVATGAPAAVETVPIELPADVAVGLYQPAVAPPAPETSTAGTPPPVASAPPSSPGVAAPAVGPAAPVAASVFTSIVSRATVKPAGESPQPAPVPPPGAPPSSRPATASAAAGAPRSAVVIPAEPSSIEARVAAARATVGATVAESVPHAAPIPGPALAAPRHAFVAPPAIAPKAVAAQTPAAVRAPGVPAPKATGLSAYTEPVALLRALRLPVTPANVSSATLALQHPEKLPSALAALERALPRATSDPNVATLRTLLAFVGRIDPRSPALPAQIAAYVDHVVDGAEPKLVTLLAASHAAVVDPEQGAPPPSRAFPPDLPPPLPLAVAAERGAALSGDLKATMLALAADPSTAPATAPVLAGALSALTAVQLTAAQTLAARPDGVAFTIPLATPNGSANAHITVKRDAPESRNGAGLDPANFRIAFSLETAHHGTVAIDLVTVGREVSVDVRTESAPAMRAFRDALGALTARLEALHYRVASAGASLGSTATIAVETTTTSYQPDPDATVDRSA